MEFFSKTKVVKLRSHLDKYLIADDNGEKVRQSRNGSVRRAQWTVEAVDEKNHLVRLKSCHGKYLTATETAFLLGMTGKTVIQTDVKDGKNEWEPIRDGFQVKLRSWSGKYLRGNGGTPPWRNTVTHDDPHGSATENWVLWDVEAVVDEEMNNEFSESVKSSFASDELSAGSDPASPMSVFSLSSPTARRNFQTMNANKFRNGIDFFHGAKAVRLRSHLEKYLLAEEDEESVTQERNGSSKSARWVVEFVPEYDNIIRLKSCYGKYLTASDHPFLLGMTGRKVLQTLPSTVDSSVEWEPIKDGGRVKLKTRYGNFLRANGGLPPWRNTVTHDIPQRTVTQDWILWDVDVMEIQAQKQQPSAQKQQPSAQKQQPSAQKQQPSAPPLSLSDSVSMPSPVVPTISASFSRQQSNDLSAGSSPRVEGRIIYYHVAEDDGVVSDEGLPGYCLTFKGNGVDELTRKVEEETGLEGIIVCNRSPFNGKLYPLRLQLPPNNATMQVVLVLPFSKVARDFEAQGLL